MKRMTNIDTAVVLAAGYGTRLRPLTAGLAKPVLPFFQATILDTILDILERSGIRRVIINLHHQGWTVRRNLRLRKHPNLKIVFSFEPEILGTAGALMPVRRLLEDRPFILMNGDVLCDVDLAAVIETHRCNRSVLATLVLHPVSLEMGFPAIGSGNNNILTRFPYGVMTDGDTDWSGTFTGIHVINPEIFRYLRDQPYQCINSTVYADALNAGETLGSFRHDGYWNDVGTPARYFNAHIDVLDGLMKHPAAGTVSTNRQWIHPDTVIDRGATLEGILVVGAGTRIGSSVHLENVIVWPDTRIQRGVYRNGILMRDGSFVHLRLEQS